mgnify:CR=1 FL=1
MSVNITIILGFVINNTLEGIYIMTVWRMNLIDNRESENRCKDPELKFRLCMEKSILGIGWGLNAAFDSWEDYRTLADYHYHENKGYTTAVNALKEMACGDLVWTQNPVTHERYLAQVLDDKPSLCCYLREFDLFSYRKMDIFQVGAELLDCYGIPEKELSGRHTIEQIREQRLIDATKELYEFLTQSRS